MVLGIRSQEHLQHLMRRIERVRGLLRHAGPRASGPKPDGLERTWLSTSSMMAPSP
jgi:hypothetical protein